MGLLARYVLRVVRKRYRNRAYLKHWELRAVTQRTDQIRPSHILLFATLRNERLRLPYFLDYYRRLGVNHFLLIDNDSTDGSGEYLAAQPDVSLWHSAASYKRARFGMDWINWLLRKYGHDHWTLCVDPDEFLVFPYCDSRPLRALTDWLDASSVRSFSAMLLDMYPKGPIGAQPYHEGQDPLDIAGYFDSGNYRFSRNRRYGNLWIQGGPRARVFFRDVPERAPALNKIPLLRWHRDYVYISSTHMLLPRGLNLTYDTEGGEKASGCLLHTKFLDTFPAKTAEEIERRQHYANSHEYRAYHAGLDLQQDLWCRWSERYVNWRQLEVLGLMSRGGWA